MNTEIKIEGNTVHASIAGRLDTINSAKSEKDFMPLKENAEKEIVLDCTGLEYISSSGLRLFLSLRKEIQAKGGSLVIEHINDDIRNVFTITGFSNLFDIRP